MRKYKSNYVRFIVFELVALFAAYHFFADTTQFWIFILAVDVAYYLGMEHGVKSFQEGMNEGKEIARLIEEKHRPSGLNE